MRRCASHFWHQLGNCPISFNYTEQAGTNRGTKGVYLSETFFLHYGLLSQAVKDYWSVSARISMSCEYGVIFLLWTFMLSQAMNDLVIASQQFRVWGLWLACVSIFALICFSVYGLKFSFFPLSVLVSDLNLLVGETRQRDKQRYFTFDLSNCFNDNTRSVVASAYEIKSVIYFEFKLHVLILCSYIRYEEMSIIVLNTVNKIKCDTKSHLSVQNHPCNCVKNCYIYFPTAGHLFVWPEVLLLP